MIGNKLLFHGIAVTLHAVLSDRVWFGQHSETLDKIHGIPLTPEILEKVGFIKGLQHEWCNYIHPFWPHDIHFRHGRIDFDISGVTVTTLDYLHEIQNFLFLVTGSPLNIEI